MSSLLLKSHQAQNSKFLLEKTVSRCCAWLQKIYDRANQRKSWKRMWIWPKKWGGEGFQVTDRSRAWLRSSGCYLPFSLFTSSFCTGLIPMRHQRSLPPPSGSCPHRAATSGHSYSLLGAPAKVLSLDFLAWLRSHVYPWSSHCDNGHQMLQFWAFFIVLILFLAIFLSSRLYTLPIMLQIMT